MLSMMTEFCVFLKKRFFNPLSNLFLVGVFAQKILMSELESSGTSKQNRELA